MKRQMFRGQCRARYRRPKSEAHRPCSLRYTADAFRRLACAAARWRPGSAAPAPADRDRRHVVRRPGRRGSSGVTPRLVSSASCRAATRSNSIETGDALVPQRAAAAFETRQIEQVADDALEPVRLLARRWRCSAHGRRIEPEPPASSAFRCSRASRSAASSARATRRRAAAAAPCPTLRARGARFASSSAMRLKERATAATSSPPSSGARAVRSPAAEALRCSLDLLSRFRVGPKTTSAIITVPKPRTPPRNECPSCGPSSRRTSRNAGAPGTTAIRPTGRASDDHRGDFAAAKRGTAKSAAAPFTEPVRLVLLVWLDRRSGPAGPGGAVRVRSAAAAVRDGTAAGLTRRPPNRPRRGNSAGGSPRALRPEFVGDIIVVRTRRGRRA